MVAVDARLREAESTASQWRGWGLRERGGRGRPLHWQFMNCNTPKELAVAEAMAGQAPIL